MTRLRGLAISLVLLVLTAYAVPATDLAVSVIALSSPAVPSSDATLEIQTAPSASCSIVVRYKSGPSRAKGLGPKMADGKGRIAWTWRVGSNTTPGTWPIEVSCQKGETRGALRTSFQVR